MRIKTSLIVSTYNRKEALALCLESALRQSIVPDEIVVADDGSREDTKELIDSFKKRSKVPIIHVWQEDDGFRLAKIRNKAIAKCSYEYIIQIDGDLILNKYFVSDHIHFSKKGSFLKGGRVNLTKDKTEKLCSSSILPKINFFSLGVRRRLNAIHCLPLASYLLSRYKKNQTTGLGCNMSFWKEDCIKINGYDEFYEGWGGEDYDFVHRLLNLNLKRLSLKFSGIVYHLWHTDSYMYNLDKNKGYYEEVKKTDKNFCEKGIDQYL